MHRRLLRLARHSRLPLAVTVTSGLAAGLLTIAQAYLISAAIRAVFLEKQALAVVTGWMYGILAVIAGRALLAWVNEVAASSLAVRIKTGLRQRLLAHIFALGPAYTRAERTGDLAAAAVEGIEALDAYYSQYLPQLVISTLVPLSVLLIVFPLDPLSGLVLLMTAPLIPFFMYMIGKGAEGITRRQYGQLSRLSAHFLDSLQGLTTLKLFGQSRAQVRNVAAVSEQFRDATLKVLQITFLSALALELLATVSTAIVAVEVGLRLLYARMEFQQALFILILAPEFYLPLRMLGMRFHAGMSGTSAARRIYAILDSPLTGARASRTLPSDHLPSRRIFSMITFSDVSFTYPGESRPALEHIELEIRGGQHIALIGASGGGKTTLAGLLLRFFEPSSGVIRLDGQPLSQLPADEWLRGVAWVPQKPHLFHDTIAANIRLAEPAATDEQVREAARLAYLEGFVESLPEKYETVIGEGGARLSSGQAQRLALARAFLRDAGLLILDEPTSSLDPETEALLEQSARELKRGRTVITIAHRLNTVRDADLLIILEAGRIVECGSPPALLKEGGRYAALLDLGGRGAVDAAIEDKAAAPEAFAPGPWAPPSGASSSESGRSAFSRLLGFLSGSWGRVGLSVLLSALTIASSIALMGASAWLISTAALHPSIAALGVAVVGVRFFGITRGVFRYLERLVSHQVTFRLLSRLRVWFYDRLEPLAPARLMDFRAGDLLARIVDDVETLENFCIRVVAPPLTALLIGAGTAAFLAMSDPRLPLAAAGFFAAIGIFLPILALQFTRGPGVAIIRSRAEVHSRLVDGIHGLADVYAFGRTGELLRDIAAASARYGAAQRRMARVTGLQSALTTSLANLGLWSVLLLGTQAVSSGRLEGLMLAPLALLTFASFEAVTPLPLAAQMWTISRQAAGRLFEIVDAAPVVVDRPAAAREAIPARPGEPPEIEFRDLSFSYPGQPEPALDRVSFTVMAGRSVAIVGPSGAG
ncbi:MAG: thiol reductant ABC exporter subunit CydD, partial [Bacteroidota bacterium]